MRTVAFIVALVLASCGDEAPREVAAEVRGVPIRSRTPKELPTEARLMTGTAPLDRKPPAKEPRVVDGYRELDFELLTGFDYAWSATSGLPLDAAGKPVSRSTKPDALDPERIPAELRAMNETKVLVVGFMQPVEFDGDGVVSFMLTNFPGGCCFGMVPRLNEWIVVTMPGDERAEFVSYEAVEVRGVLEVGEEWSGDVVVSLFRLRPDKVAVSDE